MATEKARGCPKRTAPHFLERWRRALACKPNSVCPERRPPCRFRGDHHLSGTAVTGSLKRPTRAAASPRGRRLSAGHLIRLKGGAALLGLAPPGVCQPPLLPATLVGSYPTLSPFACVPHRRDHRPVCSLWHFPSPSGYPNGALRLGGGAPCGVRTFLAAAPQRRRATRWSGQRTTFANA